MPFPVEEKYTLQTEKKLGVTFPPSFRERMIKNNGGEAKTPQVHGIFTYFRIVATGSGSNVQAMILFGKPPSRESGITSPKKLLQLDQTVVEIN